jgi:hypothetical protein
MRRILLALILVIITFASVQTASADSPLFRAINNTAESVKIKLKGEENYTFTVSSGKTSKAVDPGTYTITYSACNGDISVSKSITITETGHWEEFGPCPIKAKFVINSNLADSFTLSMEGPESYEFTITLGKNKFLDIVSGDYTYTHDYCGENIAVSGSIRVTKNGQSRLTLNGCEREEILSFGVPNPSNMRLASHYAFPINVTFIGPKQYYLTLPLGFTRIDMIRGTYSYFYSAYGKIVSGEIEVTGGGVFNTIVFSPAKVGP